MTVTQELIGFSAMASLWTLGIIRVRNMLWGLALVGAALGILPLHDGLQHGNPSEIWLGCAVIVTKAIGVPLFLNWNAIRLNIVRDRTVGLRARCSFAARRRSGCAVLLQRRPVFVAGLYPPQRRVLEWRS